MGLDSYMEHKISKREQTPDGRPVTKSIQTEFGYWRKFYALHDYIIENFNDDVDDCRPIELDLEQLTEVLTILEGIKANHDEGEANFPNRNGVCDEGYFNDVELSIPIIKQAIAYLQIDYPTYDEWSAIIYQASW